MAKLSSAPGPKTLNLMLNLPRTKLDELCKDLEGNSAWTELNISRNDLGYEGGIRIATMLGINKSLTSIDLSGINIKGTLTGSIPPEFIQALAKNSTVQEIDLRSNYFTEPDYQEVSLAMKSNFAITELKIAHPTIAKQSPAIQQTLGYIQHNQGVVTSIKDFICTGTTYDPVRGYLKLYNDKFYQILKENPAAIPFLNSILWIKRAFKSIDTDPFACFPREVIEHIISYGALDDKANSPIEINYHKGYVRIPHVPNNQAEVAGIWKKLAKNTKTTTLDLSGADVGEIGGLFGYVSRILETNRDLTELDLSCNGITSKAIIRREKDMSATEHLCSKIKLNNNTLKCLNLSYNPIGDDGAEHTADVLKTTQGLTSLGLADTALTSEGITALAKGLAENSTLTSLDLRSNNLSEGDLTNLLELGVRHNTSLREIKLLASYRGNDISEDSPLQEINAILNQHSMPAEEEVGLGGTTEVAVDFC